MKRLSWSSGRPGRIQLGEKQPSDLDVPKRNIPVPKAALEDGILHLLATAAEMQQRQDLESANQLYEAAIAKMKAHKLDRKKFLSGTSKKPPPLNSRTAIEWSFHVGDLRSAITLLGDPNVVFTQLLSTSDFTKIDAILKAGADVEYRVGPFGRTYLLREAGEGREEGVKLALEHGASISCMDDGGDTALSLALRTQSSSPRLVEMLISAGADVSLTDGQGQPLLLVAAKSANAETLKQILDALAPLKNENLQQMQSYITFLPRDGKSIGARDSEVIRILLEHGLDPNTRCPSAANPSLLDIVLLQAGDGADELVSELLERGAEIDLELALQHAQPSQLELILSKLHPLTESNRELVVSWTRTLLSLGRKWTKRDGNMLALLLDFGLDPNTRSDKAPHSPLIVCAAHAGDTNLVDKLIAHKANLDASNDDSDTAIVVAAKQKNRQIYDSLKAGGVNDKYFFGWTVWTHHANS